MHNKTCIIILNWNGKNDTISCLNSLLLLDTPPSEIILVDNGSTDNSVEEIRELFPHVTLLETGKNLGFAGGNNVGIQYGMEKGYEFFFLLNNDTTVDPNVLNAFLSTFEHNPKMGILGAKIYLMSQPNRLDHFGGMWNSKKCEFDLIGYRKVDEGQFDIPLSLDYVCGAAMIVRRTVFEAVGLFDPRFFLYWEEADFCFRARSKGFEIMTCPHAKVWHKVSASITSKPYASYFFSRNRLLWIEKNFTGHKRLIYLFRLLSLKLPQLIISKNLRVSKLLLQKISKKESQSNREKILRYDAMIFGMRDYLIRSFGKGKLKKFQ